MACRDAGKGLKVAEEIQTKVPGAEVHVLSVELDSLESVRKFCEQVITQFPHVNILINNAGVLDATDGKLRKTRDGFETNMGINYLGHFLLTLLLLDHVKKAAPSRIVLVGSAAQAIAKLDLEDLNLERSSLGLFSGIPYANSKLALALFAKELAKRLEGTGVSVYVMCPGLVRTSIFRQAATFQRVMLTLVSPFAALSPDQGCETILYCSVGEESAGETGQMYRFRSRWEAECSRLDDKYGHISKKLWDLSESLVGLKDGTGSASSSDE